MSQVRTKETLTHKQYGFACSVIAGEFDTVYDAYAAHYNTGKMKIESVKRASMELLNHPGVADMIQEARDALVQSAKLSGQVNAEEITQRLFEIADAWRGEYWEGAELVNKGQKGHPSAAVTALAEIAKLHGLNYRHEEEKAAKGGTLNITGIPEAITGPSPEASHTAPPAGEKAEDEANRDRTGASAVPAPAARAPNTTEADPGGEQPTFNPDSPMLEQQTDAE